MMGRIASVAMALEAISYPACNQRACFIGTRPALRLEQPLVYAYGK